LQEVQRFERIHELIYIFSRLEGFDAINELFHTHFLVWPPGELKPRKGLEVVQQLLDWHGVNLKSGTSIKLSK